MALRILGIDPGYDRMGVALLEGSREKPFLLHSTCIETTTERTFSERLGEVCDAVRKIIEEFTPKVIALEDIFFSKNQKTAIHVAEIRGAILLLAHEYSIPVFEYNPGSIKIAITGVGNADKKQVFFMLGKIIALPETGTKKRLDDEYDAISVALTHLVSHRYPHS